MISTNKYQLDRPIKFVSVFAVTCFLLFSSCSGPDTNSRSLALGVDPASGFYTDTIQLHGIDFVMMNIRGSFAGLLKMNGDTVIPFRENYVDYTQRDIDGDSLQDLIISIMGSWKNAVNMYLYRPGDSSFRLIRNYDIEMFPVAGVGLSCSYQAAGCADMNWVSQLLRITGDSVVVLGEIINNECGNPPNSLSLYRGADGASTLLWSSSDIIPKETSFDSIPRFWKRHYKECL
ncbi:MAG: hypothetical protein EOO09_04455 [Chitinophagaceae bacterium]|nr:MAG: hypothetical protein EOO09_04455 [Chitinophagaceae bacterium]